MSSSGSQIILYDLAGDDPERRFSPYCWRVKMALAHKGLEFATIAWRFTDKEEIAFSNQDLVPVLVDGKTYVSDSWRTASYLEQKYTDRRSLFGGEAGRAITRFVNGWADSVLVPLIGRIIAADIHSKLHEKDRAYFRATRETRFGATLEELSKESSQRVPEFRRALEPVRAVLREQPFIAGRAPLYADYIVFGCLQWARCVSPIALLDESDPVWRWKEALLDSFNGMARHAPAE